MASIPFGSLEFCFDFCSDRGDAWLAGQAIADVTGSVTTARSKSSSTVFNFPFSPLAHPPSLQVFSKTMPSANASASARVGAVSRHLGEGPGAGVKTVVVFGAGLMGAGIAQIAAQAGYTVHLVDVNDKAIA